MNQKNQLIPLSEYGFGEYYSLSGDWGYRLFREGEFLDTVSYSGFKDEWLNADEPKRIGLEYEGAVFNGLAINKVRPITFGEIIPADTFIPEYQEYIAQILSDNQLQGETVHINGIFRTDLEGDGVEEVLVMASNINAEDKIKGQYSIVVLRKLIDGKVESLFLVKEVKTNLPTDVSDSLFNEYKLCEIVDLDDDGVCELLIRSSFYGGYSYQVYELNGNEITMVLESGSGV